MSFFCEKCEKTFPTQVSMTDHCGSSTHNLQCYHPSCRKSFDNLTDLRDHRTSGAHGPSFDCHQCQKGYASVEALRQHRRTAQAHSEDSIRLQQVTSHSTALIPSTPPPPPPTVPNMDVENVPLDNPSLAMIPYEDSIKSSDEITEAKRHSSYPPHSCHKCGESFPTDHALRLHRQVNKHYFCSRCNKDFNFPKALTMHLNSLGHIAAVKAASAPARPQLMPTSHGSLPPTPTNAMQTLHCNECQRTFKDEDALGQHLMSSAVHKKCNLCGKLFPSREALRMHMDSTTHNPSSLSCNGCGKSFKDQEALDQHSRNSMCRIHRCRECGRQFGNREGLRMHMQSTTHNKPTLYCKECGKFFKDHEALIQHVHGSLSHQTLHTCRRCEMTFPDQNTLRRHLASQAHNHCLDCNISFNSQRDISQHINSTDHIQRTTNSPRYGPVGDNIPLSKGSGMISPDLLQSSRLQLNQNSDIIILLDKEHGTEWNEFGREFSRPDLCAFSLATESTLLEGVDSIIDSDDDDDDILGSDIEDGGVRLEL